MEDTRRSRKVGMLLCPGVEVGFSVQSLTEPVSTCFPNFPSVLGHPKPLVVWVKIFQVCKMNTVINTIVGNCSMEMLIS